MNTSPMRCRFSVGGSGFELYMAVSRLPPIATSPGRHIGAVTASNSMIIITDQGGTMDIIDAKPTADEIEELREDMTEMADGSKRVRVASSSGWRPTYDDWLYERDTCRHHADEANRLRWERDAYAKQVETLAKERDVARSELDLCTGRLQTAVAEVKELRDMLAAAKQDAEEWRFTAGSRERVTTLALQDNDMLRASLVATQAELAQTRQAADEWATKARALQPAWTKVEAWHAALPPVPCGHSKAKQFGPATFVMRRCKLADGHDGMCEPA